MSLFSSVFSFASICLLYCEKHLFSPQDSRNDKSGNNMICININVGLLWLVRCERVRNIGGGYGAGGENTTKSVLCEENAWHRPFLKFSAQH